MKGELKHRVVGARHDVPYAVISVSRVLIKRIDGYVNLSPPPLSSPIKGEDRNDRLLHLTAKKVALFYNPLPWWEGIKGRGKRTPPRCLITVRIDAS
jgi:hypothetical protein